MKFCSGGMLAATRVKMSDSEKGVNMNTSDIPSIKRVTRSFWKFQVTVVQNNGKEMYKKVCCMCKVAFLLIRPIVVVVICLFFCCCFSAVLLAFAA